MPRVQLFKRFNLMLRTLVVHSLGQSDIFVAGTENSIRVEYMLKVRNHHNNSLRVVSILLLLRDHGVFLYLSTAVYLYNDVRNSASLQRVWVSTAKKIDSECYGRNQRGAAKPILPLALNMIKECWRPAKETNRDESRDENFDISLKCKMLLLRFSCASIESWKQLKAC